MKKFAKEFFLNTKIIADKFHLVRLANNMVNSKRLEIIKQPENKFLKSRKNPLRKMLLANGQRLHFQKQRVLMYIFDRFRELEAFYRLKKMIHELYRIRGYNRAKKYFTQITNFMSSLKLEGMKSSRKTLLGWQKEILNYFKRRLINGKTEGFDRKTKLIQRGAYGFKSFPNYRLKLIYLSR